MNWCNNIVQVLKTFFVSYMCIISYFNYIAGKISIVLSSYKFVSIFFLNNEQNICLPLEECGRLYLVAR